MAKKVSKVLTIQIPAGQANPAPPVGTALGPLGINIMDFCKAYNEQSSSMSGQIVPARITVYEDRSFTFVLRTPPAADMLRKAAGINKGAADPLRQTAGRVTQQQLREIAETKMPDLSATTIEAAMLTIAGTARSMGIEVN